MIDLDALDFAKNGGVVTVVTQDAVTGAVLMVAHADRAALARTTETGEMHYTSRTRGLWRKGATSGNVQHVVSITADCDGDAVLARVRPAGPACHTGDVTCFDAVDGGGDALSDLSRTIAERAAAVVPDGPSYTQRLLADRNLRLKKIGEEAAEFVLACADESAPRAVSELADLVYHAFVALAAMGATADDVRRELDARAKPRGVLKKFEGVPATRQSADTPD